jgi:hypothetical protein
MVGHLEDIAYNSLSLPEWGEGWLVAPKPGEGGGGGI